MSITKKLLIGSMTTIISLLCTETKLTSTALAATWTRSYACNQSAVTISEQALGLYTYKAANARGDKLVVKNGTYYRDQARHSTYIFHNDDTEFTLREIGKGKAELTTRRHGDAKATFNCTATGTRSLQPSGSEQASSTERSSSSERATTSTSTGEQFTQILGIKLGTPIEEIQKTLGSSPMRKTGDAATALSTICYTTDSNEVVEFSQGELSSGYSLRKPKAGDSQSCPKLPASLNKFTGISGIKLGMTKQDFEKRFGKPKQAIQDSLRYNFQRTGKTSDSNQKTFVSIDVNAKFDASKLVQFSVNKTEST